MKIRIGILLAAVLLTAAAAPAEQIAYERSSWGKPFGAWSIDANGDGIYTYADESVSKTFGNYDLVTMRFHAGTAGYAEIARMLKPVRAGTANPPKCDKHVLDAPSASLSWTGTKAVSRNFYYGCLDDAWQRLFEPMTRAEKRIAVWGRAGELVGRERIGQ